MIEETGKISEEEKKKQAEEQEKLISEAKKKIEQANNVTTNEIQQKLASNKPTVQQDPTGHWQKTEKPRFEIELYEEETWEETGEHKGWKKVHTDQPIIIRASCKADFDEYASKFAICKQRMKIVRCLDEEQKPQPNCSQPIVNQTANVQSIQQPQPIVNQLRSKPKFYKIGNIEIKDDNGKIYQKQWVKLSESESSNFRIINDKTNSIVNLKGKSIEMKKWILVEKSDDEITSLEENLNG